MTDIKSLCVFCGAAVGDDPVYRAAARTLGAAMGRRGIRLVFGAGHVGMMGILADAVLAAGGEAVGVIPRHLMDRELAHDGLTELHVVDSMHVRKQLMFDLADAIAVLPGGFGTLDETFEVITWKQLGLHDKPILLIDTAGYWRPFVDLISGITRAGFAHSNHARLFEMVATPDELFELLERLPASHIPADPSRF
jgi:uncharacterized protein (TIGR00730 family)